MGKRIITYGTFDLFHIGHVRLLKRLAGLGGHLTVCVSTDEFNAIKGKKTVIPFEQRAEILGACRYVDNVLPENDWAQKRDDIMREKIDIFAMGDDWSGKFNDLSDLCEVFYLPRTEDISSTSMKAFMEALRDDQLLEIKHLIETLNAKASAL
ncbi:MAG: adenylyltransferase/cytidyltransferase family protein [Roseicyclus sp.]|nr:adenylyltransferase/cytidyltransferase family protein [Roseicyclus sp.]